MAELYEIAAEFRAEIRAKDSEIERLTAQLDDYKNALVGAMDEKCSLTEEHCTCVPLLRTEIKRLQQQLESSQAIQHAEKKILLEEVAINKRLRDALVRYGGHLENCDSIDFNPEGIIKPCNCGFTTALAGKENV